MNKFDIVIYVKGSVIGGIVVDVVPSQGDNIIFVTDEEHRKYVASDFKYKPTRAKVCVLSRTWILDPAPRSKDICNLECTLLSENV